ncbi:putative membrane protein [Desulfitobacterium dichloroeliminans LMG P-21439]|uniref:Putative membrane protein n=1 Tax=Desulfitobacterium dichloroeliminans (strain LMG P-21439 / DCA1) TaxID=871963 RepID=L0FCI0_DESDL|nr:DUF445 domain-containing protein [Desulfitobacterium dichloroeliminans]AGA70648.1 putative membrane protein [Desulfitobacterium dichloroeliminans LMG P-21439]
MNEVPTTVAQTKKVRGKTYRKANIALGLSALGLAIVYPFQGSFGGGLLTSGCTAALVGGLADWFAVKALFRRPLGVRPGKVFRTEIIPRNRERIFQALTDMVEKELLSQEALQKKLETYDFATPAIKTWDALGRERVGPILDQFLLQLQVPLSLSLEDLKKENEALFRQESLSEKLDPLVGHALLQLWENEEGKKLITAGATTLGLWIQETEVHLWLTHWLEHAIERYISENPSRRFLVMFLPEPSDLALKLQNQISDYLREETTQAEIGQWLKQQAQNQAYRLTAGEEPDPPSQKTTYWATTTVMKLLQELAKGYLEKLDVMATTSKRGEQLLEGLESGIASLKESPEKQGDFNAYVQAKIIPLINSKHQKIGQLVHEGLEKYSNEMLVELIESKAGEDLQMIRINGSVVGGLAGMLIYLASSLL